MKCGMNKPISIWPRGELFSFGIFPMQPHPRLSVNNIKRLIAYAKIKSSAGCTRLKYGVWKHVACNKLNFNEEAAWTYFETCLVLSCRKMEHLMEMESILAKTNDVAEKENTRLQQSVDLYTFSLFLYMNQINKLSLRSSVASVSGEWPESPSKSMDGLTARSTTRMFKNTSEQCQLQFITDYLTEILELVSDPEIAGSDTLSSSVDDKYIRITALDSLSFIFEGTVDRMNSVKPLRDILFDPLCIPHVGYDKLTKTFSMRCLHSWMRANLRQCPFSVESCVLNGTRIQWGGSDNMCDPSPTKSNKRQKITTNIPQLPPSTGFRGNKIVAAEMLHKQFVARASRFLKYATVRLHRTSSSFIYLLVPLRCVALDRCRNSTIVLGPIESTLTLTDCEDCLIIAAARRVVVWASHRCTLHLLCATRPLLIQPPPAAASSTSTGDSHSCPPSPLAGVTRGLNHLGNEDIIFAPFHTTYPELRHHLDKAALDPTVNLWGKPLLFGNDFWRSGPGQCQFSGIWGLLPPDNFFPFNIPLAPLMSHQDGGGVVQHTEGVSVVHSAPGMWLKEKAYDVCRGLVVDCDQDGDPRKDDLDTPDNEFDSPTKRVPLLVPLPPVYAEALNKRRSAYEKWQKTIQDADLTEDETVFLSECIETQFKAWLIESGMLKELKLLDSASSVTKRRQHRRSEIYMEEGSCITTPSSVPRRSLHQCRRQINSTTAV